MAVSNTVVGNLDRDDLVKEIHQALHTGTRRRASSSKRAELSWLELNSSGLSHYPLYTGNRSKLPILERQTYKRWKSMMGFQKVRHPRRQRRKVIIIQPITYFHGQTPLRHTSNGTADEEEEAYRHVEISEEVLRLLQEFCAAYFVGMEVKLEKSLDLAEIPKLTSRIHKATNRRQFLVDDVINFLTSYKLQKAYCILGVTTVDLYPGPEWNFVLGQASLEVGSGVFSFGRYFNSTHTKSGYDSDLFGEEPAKPNRCGKEISSGCGMEGEELTSPLDGSGIKEEELIGGCDSKREELIGPLGGSGCDKEWVGEEQIRNLWVLMRVMSHELCHLFGLAHCHYFQCAMNESSSITEAATQPLFLCPICLRKLNKMLNFNLAQRYSGLWEVTKKLRGAVDRALKMDSLNLEKEITKSSSEDKQASTQQTRVINGDTTITDISAGHGDHVSNPVDHKTNPTGHVTNSLSDVLNNPTCEERQVSLHSEGESGYVERLDEAIAWLERVILDIEEYNREKH